TSPGGHSAWASDVVSVGGQRIAVTAVLSSSDDLWAASAAMLAETPTGKQVRAEAARDAIVPPGAAAAAKLGPGAGDAVERLKKGLVDPQRRRHPHPRPSPTRSRRPPRTRSRSPTPTRRRRRRRRSRSRPPPRAARPSCRSGGGAAPTSSSWPTLPFGWRLDLVLLHHRQRAAHHEA